MCVCLCVCACSRSHATAPRPPPPPPPPRRLHLSLGSRGQYVPLSQVVLQRVEDAELLFGLKQQQLLQQLAGVRAPATQRSDISAPPTTRFKNGPRPPARLHSPDEAGDVDVRERGHQVLTVKAIHDAAVAGDSARKVLQDRRGDLRNTVQPPERDQEN